MKLTDSSLAFAGSNTVRAIASSSSTSNQFMVYGDTTITKVLSGTGVGLVKNGLGTLTLSAANTYTGNTTISAGILTITDTSALPGYNTNGRFAVAPNATLAVYNAVSDSDITTLRNTTNFNASANLGFDTTSGDRTYTPLLSNTSQGALGIVKLGTNTLTLTSANTYTGQTNVLAGTLYAGTANDIIPNSSPVYIASGAIINCNGSETIATLSGAGNLYTNSQLTFNSSNNATFTGFLSSSYYPPNVHTIVYKTGTGTQTFSGANSVVLFGDYTNPTSHCPLRHDNGGISIIGGTFAQILTGSSSVPRNYQMGISSGTNTTLTVAESGIMYIKGIMLGENDATSNNTINISSGGKIDNSGDTWFAGASGTMNIDNGLFSSQNIIEIGGGTNTLNAVNNVNVSNGGVLRIFNNGINFGRSRVSINTLNLNSNGTLSGTYVGAITGVNANSNIVNFNGGIYSPIANTIVNSSSSFLTYRIKSGGATFNIPSGWTNTFNANLLQDSSSTGGGLTKTGEGVMYFGGTGSTYTGQLSVLEGTFSVASVNNNSANGVFGNSTLPIVLGSNGKTATLQYTAVTNVATTKGITIPTGAVGIIDVTNISSTILTLNGSINGSGSLFRIGTGQLVYSGNNTYSGGTTLSGAGINNVNSDTAFGTGPIYFSGCAIRSAGGVSSPNRTITNDIIINAATNTFNSNTNEHSLILAGPVTLTRQATLNVAVGTSTSEALIISGPIGDGGNAYQLNKTGTGVLVLSGQNTFSGPIFIQVGNMRILYPTIGDIRTTSGNLQFAAGITNDISSSIRNNTQAVRINTNGQNVTFASLLSSNSAGLTKLGTGTLTLSTTPIGTSPNGIRGTITANGGNLTLTGTLSTVSRVLVSNGAGTSGTLSISGSLIQSVGTSPRNFQVAPTAGVTGTVNVYSGGTLRSVNGGIMLGENGGGTGRMNLYGGEVNLLGSNQFWFAGPTATLSMSAGSTLNVGGTMYFSGGIGNVQSIFNMSGGTANIGTLIVGQTNSGTATLNLDGGLLSVGSTVINTVSAHTFNFNGGTFRVSGNTTIPTTPILLIKSGGCIYEQTANTTTINGILSSQGVDGGLTKLGSGLLSLNAINTYTGTTAISAGTLRVLKKISGTGTDASFTQADFGLSTLSVTFNSIPNIGDTYKLFPSSTVNTYSSITLNGASGRTATYDSSNSTLTIA
jgi:autotransporter-associated beta strand protein